MSDEITYTFRQKIIDLIDYKLSKAYAKHGSEKWGRHEFYGIIKEEFDEMWDEIKSDGKPEDLVWEIIDVLLVGIRYLETDDKYKPFTKEIIEKLSKDK